MCGTPNSSRTIRRSGRPGVGTTVVAPVGLKSSRLKYFGMSASVTLPRSGVRPSYSGTWSWLFFVSPAPPAWPGGRML